MTNHTLSILVSNRPGVLTRIAALFSRRGFNIESLAVGPTEREEISRMTVVAQVEDDAALGHRCRVGRPLDLRRGSSLDRAVAVLAEVGEQIGQWACRRRVAGVRRCRRGLPFGEPFAMAKHCSPCLRARRG